jgi:hypothetical protein
MKETPSNKQNSTRRGIEYLRGVCGLCRFKGAVARLWWINPDRSRGDRVLCSECLRAVGDIWQEGGAS